MGVCEQQEICNSLIEHLMAERKELSDALKGMLEDAGYTNMSDSELIYELGEGNQGVRCIIKARAALAKVSP